MDQPGEPAPAISQDHAGHHGPPTMMGYWDRNLTNAIADGALTRWFGFTEANIRGAHLSDVLGPVAYQASIPHVAAVLGGTEEHWTLRSRGISGENRTFHVSFVPYWTEGSVAGFVSLFTDLTLTLAGERQAKQDAERYRALARSIPSVFVLLFDTDLRYIVAEGQALKTFGYTSDELEGRTIFECLPDKLIAEVEPRYWGALRGEETTWSRDVGSRTFSLTACPVATEGPISAGMVVAMDITRARQKEQTWAALHEISTAIVRNEDTASVSARVSDVLLGLFRVEKASVVRFIEQDEVRAVAVSPPDAVIVQGTHKSHAGSGLAADAVRCSGAAAISRYAPDSNCIAEATMFTSGFRSSAAAPINVAGEAWGAVVISARSNERINADVLGRLSEFATLVEIAIGNTQARADLEHQARTDALTGLPNRRTFQERLDREMQGAADTGGPLSLVVFDVDRFKSINDTFGHSTGDAVLTEIARRLQGVSRDGEMMARLGGEEFVWLLPGVPADSARLAAEHAGESISSVPFSEQISVTVSSGVCDLATVTAAELLDAADRALFEAKRQGRNRSIVYRSPA